MCLSTDQLKFLDIINYIATGFSYDKYLKVYGCEVTIGHFPYEYMDRLERLDDTALPSKQAFFSRLKNEGISDEDYASCQEAWRDNAMTTLRDFLVWYNNRDVVPFLQAIDRLLPATWHRHVQARHQRTWSDLALPVQRPSREDLLYHLQREE